jgi:L,D-transpeptidase YcbB
MRKYFFFILIIILIPFLLHAQNKVPELIKAKLDQLGTNKDTEIAGEKFHSIEYVSNLYAKNDYKPFWTGSGSIEDAINGINNAYDDGLQTADYHLDAILRLQGELAFYHGGNVDKVGQVERDAREEKMVELDLLLTDGVIFYADHLLYGKINPVTIVQTWNFGFAPIPDLNASTLTEYITGHEISTRLNDLRPNMPIYDTLLSILARYRGIEKKGGWQLISAGGKIEPGHNDPRIPAIRHRMQITGELSVNDSLTSDLYDNILEKDIKAFQSAHALDPDGIIGAGTFRELNVPVKDRIGALRINLERVRWVSGNLPEKYIIVNIAAFWMIMVNDSKIVHSASVVVGKPLNKTPIFRDKMRYIEFNPTWMQPTSIIKNETVPMMKKDSNYLAKNHLELLDLKGNPVSISKVDMKKLSASHFPYLVRQEPGPWNALGAIKFMFPNKYDIYLHDTPSKSLFSRGSRAFSHGCIRVDKPIDLAEKLLAGTEYDRKKINEIISTRVTTRVNLPQPLDILLLYWTCGIDKNGKLFFVPDIYDRDLAVLMELDKAMR